MRKAALPRRPPSSTSSSPRRDRGDRGLDHALARVREAIVERGDAGRVGIGLAARLLDEMELAARRAALRAGAMALAMRGDLAARVLGIAARDQLGGKDLAREPRGAGDAFELGHGSPLRCRATSGPRSLAEERRHHAPSSAMRLLQMVLSCN
jgi:hypothetical protein